MQERTLFLLESGGGVILPNGEEEEEGKLPTRATSITQCPQQVPHQAQAQASTSSAYSQFNLHGINPVTSERSPLPCKSTL